MGDRITYTDDVKKNNNICPLLCHFAGTQGNYTDNRFACLHCTSNCHEEIRV